MQGYKSMKVTTLNININETSVVIATLHILPNLR